MAADETKQLKPKELKPEVSAKYNVLPGIGVGEVHFKGQKIQLDQIGLKETDELVKQGFDVLVAKQAPTKS